MKVEDRLANWYDTHKAKLGIIIIAIGVLSLIWFLPVRSESIYADYTHWGPHPCWGRTQDDYEFIAPDGDWENLSSEEKHYWQREFGGCIYHEDPFPLKGGHAYYNIFGIEIHRQWEWIS